MLLKIFLLEEDFDCLRKFVPYDSTCRSVLDGAVPLGNTRVLDCDDIEARQLIIHALAHCPAAAANISRDIRAAGLT